jgi:hypothetical protein
MKITSKKIKCHGIEYWEIDHDKYKYMLAKNYSIQTDIYDKSFNNPYFRLYKNGKLICKQYYCWDGASGPTIDTESNMRGSLIHDVLYQAMHMNFLSRKYRKYADDFFYEIIREDGMNLIRAKYYWLAVRSVGWIFI